MRKPAVGLEHTGATAVGVPMSFDVTVLSGKLSLPKPKCNRYGTESKHSQSFIRMLSRAEEVVVLAVLSFWRWNPYRIKNSTSKWHQVLRKCLKLH